MKSLKLVGIFLSLSLSIACGADSVLSPGKTYAGARMTREPVDAAGMVAFRVSFGALRGIAALSGRVQSDFPIELSVPLGAPEPRMINNAAADGPAFALFAPENLDDETLVTLRMPASELREGAEFRIHIEVAADELGRNRLGSLPLTLRATYVRDEWRMEALSR